MPSRSVLVLTGIVAILLAGCATAPDARSASAEAVVQVESAQPESTLPAAPSAAHHFVRGQEAWDSDAVAIAEFTRAIELDSDFALAYFERARRYKGRGEPRRALADLNAAIERDPGLVQAYIERGELRLWELGDEGGYDDFRAAYAVGPDDLQAGLSYAGLIAWDEPEEAAAIYDRMVALHAERPQAHLARAKFNRDRGSFQEALEGFRSAFAAGDESPYILAEALMMRLAAGDRAGAQQDAAELARRYPDSPETALMRARLAAITGNAARAAELYPAYFEQDWADPAVALEAAYASAAAGMERDARDWLERFSSQKDDRLRISISRAGVALLAGSRRDGLALLDSVLSEADWSLEAHLMTAVADPDSGSRDVFAERVREFKPGPRAYFPFNPDMWVWVSLYRSANPGSTTPGLTLP